MKTLTKIFYIALLPMLGYKGANAQSTELMIGTNMHGKNFESLDTKISSEHKGVKLFARNRITVTDKASTINFIDLGYNLTDVVNPVYESRITDNVDNRVGIDNFVKIGDIGAYNLLTKSLETNNWELFTKLNYKNQNYLAEIENIINKSKDYGFHIIRARIGKELYGIWIGVGADYFKDNTTSDLEIGGTIRKEL